MFQARAIGNVSKPELYRDIAQQLEALLAGERDAIANAANAAALLYHALADINWAGFYFLRGEELLMEAEETRVWAEHPLDNPAALRGLPVPDHVRALLEQVES